MKTSHLILGAAMVAILGGAACNRADTDQHARLAAAEMRDVAARAAAAPVATTGVAPLDDARITSSIQAKYFLDHFVKGRRIDVDTRQGIVTLRGEVGSDNERAQALLLARTTEGVERVEDGLTVNTTLAEAPTLPSTRVPAAVASQSLDTGLTKSIQETFAADRQVKAGSIEVTAKDGVVLLDGTAPNNAARQRALIIARGTDGVVQVIDRITLRK